MLLAIIVRRRHSHPAALDGLLWAEALFFKMAHKEERGSLNGKGYCARQQLGFGSGFLTMTYPHICLAAAAWRNDETNVADTCRHHQQPNGWPRLSPWIGSSNELCHGCGHGVSDASDVSGCCNDRNGRAYHCVSVCCSQTLLACSSCYVIVHVLPAEEAEINALRLARDRL